MFLRAVDREQGLAVVDRIALGDVDAGDPSGAARAHRIAYPERLDVGQLAVRVNRVTLLQRMLKMHDADDLRRDDLVCMVGLVAPDDTRSGRRPRARGGPA